MPTVVSEDLRLWSPSGSPGTGILDIIFSGDCQLPQFQRDYVWNLTDRKKLLISILENHPIGSILSLEVDAESPQFSWTQFNSVIIPKERREDFKPKNKRNPPRKMILDGQQRFTTLARLFSYQPKENWYIMLDWVEKDGSTPNSLFRKYKDHCKDTDSVPSAAVWGKWLEEEIDLESIIKKGSVKEESTLFTKLKWGKNARKLPVSLVRSKQDWKDAKQKFSLSKKKQIMDLEHKIMNAYKNKDTEKQSDLGKQKDELEIYSEFLFEFMDMLTDRLSEYTIPVVSIPKDMGIGGVCKVFTNLNTKGVKLSAFDLCVATLFPSGIRLKEKWDEARAKNTLLSIMDDPKLPLQTIALLEGKSPKTAKLPEVIKPEMVNNLWDDAVDSLETAMEYLDEHCGTDISGGSDKCLPYKPLLCPLAALIRDNPMKYGTSLSAKEVEFNGAYRSRLMSWHFTSAATQRYTEGTDNKQELDYKEMKSWFGKDSQNWREGAPSWMTEEGMSSLYRSSSGGLGKGILSLLNSTDPRDWANDNLHVRYGSNTPSDLHHIFPRAMMIEKIIDEHGISKEKATKKFNGNNIADGEYAGNSPVNLAWLSTDTNNSYIDDKPPSKYLVDLSKVVTSQEKLRQILQKQGIGKEAFDAMLVDDYHAFREARAQELKNMLSANGNLSDDRTSSNMEEEE